MKKIITVVTAIIIATGLAGLFISAKPAKRAAGRSVLKETGRRANLRQSVLKIEGMFCAGCATAAEYALKEKVGVVDAHVDYDNQSGRVVYDPSKISKDEIIRAVKPYAAVIIEDTPVE